VLAEELRHLAEDWGRNSGILPEDWGRNSGILSEVWQRNSGILPEVWQRNSGILPEEDDLALDTPNQIQTDHPQHTQR